MRRLNVSNKKALKVVKELDAFPKIPENYQETTASGGGISILVFIVIGILVVSEFQYYRSTQLKFQYDVDTELDGKLKINVDITVKMKCQNLGADVLDLTGQDTHTGTIGELKEEPVHFELSEQQKAYQEMMQSVNKYLREEYHAIQDFLWHTGFSGLVTNMPKREDKPEGEPDACRIYGSLTVNKVAGNFHITAGKSIPVFPRGHAHLSMMLDDQDYNFSHRIDRLSFGEPLSGLIHPLDGDEKITTNNYHMFQYFIQVVSTKVRTNLDNLDTYQYAVTERNRTIDHSKGSHGVPGIFVKYDLSSLQVSVREEHQPYWQFMVRVCGIIGGVFATSGMLHSIVGFLVDVVCCRYGIGKYKQQEERPLQTQSFSTKMDSLDNGFPSETVAGVSLLSTKESDIIQPVQLQT